MSSCNHSEEEHSAQLQLVLSTLSTADAMPWEDLYWQFLDNARRFNHLDAMLPADAWRPRVHVPVRLLEARLPAPSKPSNRCILCFDDVAAESDTKIPCGIACPRSHVIHRQCLDSLIVNHCETVLHTPSTPSHIDCPACTSQRNHEVMLQPFHKSIPIQVLPYTEEQLKLGACQKALDLLAAVAQADQTLAALPENEQITNGNTDCYLCPKCKFGPVAHAACHDLTSHHAHGGVSNKCPKCGFFGSSISQWIRISEPRQPTINPPAAAREFDFHDVGLRGLGGWVEVRNHWAHYRQNRMPRILPVPFERFDGGSTFEMNVGGRALPRHDEWLLAPSYWDAVTLRLVRTAMQAAAVSNRGVAAIANCSHTADSAVELDSALCLFNESVSEQSLVVTRHACLRVHSVQLECTAALAAVLRHAARSNTLQPCWAGLPDAVGVGLMRMPIMLISQCSKYPLMRATRGRCAPSMEYTARGIDVGDDDREAQADKLHEGQLGCCRVV
jgi:hypothetical protein